MAGLNLWFSETGFLNQVFGMKHKLLQKPGFSCGHASPLQDGINFMGFSEQQPNLLSIFLNYSSHFDTRYHPLVAGTMRQLFHNSLSPFEHLQ